MKVKGAILLIALFATGPAAAQQWSASTPAPLIIQKEKSKIHWFTPVRTTEGNNDLTPVEGLSRRAWTTTAGWHPGVSSFPDAETYSSRLCLLWAGHTPWQQATHVIGEQ